MTQASEKTPAYKIVPGDVVDIYPFIQEFALEELYPELEYEYYVVEDVKQESLEILAFYSSESGANLILPKNYLLEIVDHLEEAET